jgi:glycosyltransferase involved in cell wall biosynthesis
MSRSTSSTGNVSASTPLLTVVVPVYNEERTITAIMDRVFAACGDSAECIFVDDGSKDRSLEILRQKARSQDTVLTKLNGGKGSAVRMGYKHAKGFYTIVQDADLEYSPEEIPMLLEFARKNDADAVFGSRRLKKQKQYVHLSFFLGGTLLTYLCNVLYGTRLTDQPTCYKMVKTVILAGIPLRENDFRFDPELTAYLALRKVKIFEYPVSYHPRTVAEGKKICWKDWFRWVWVFLRMRVIGR